MSRKYILDGHIPVLEPDLRKWARWYELDANRIIAQTHTQSGDVSTVFLALEPLGSDPLVLPDLFETAVFGGPWDETRKRFATWEEAEQAHHDMVRLLCLADAPAETLTPGWPGAH